jgi:HSP20 family molecular chaperone IbpA
VAAAELPRVVVRVELPGMDKAEASFRNGVLTVRLPKGASDKARAIQVS